MQASIFGACSKSEQIGRVVARKVSGVKMGNDGGESLISLDGVVPRRMVVCLLLTCSLASQVQKFSSGSSGKMAVKRLCVWITKRASGLSKPVPPITKGSLPNEVEKDNQRETEKMAMNMEMVIVTAITAVGISLTSLFFTHTTFDFRTRINKNQFHLVN